MTERVRVGTRRSRLARVQTDGVLERLRREAPDRTFEVVPIDASGDRDRTVGGSPDFTDTIDRALARGEIDLAVHSAKDLPVELDPRFRLVATPRRFDPRDCLVVGSPTGGTELARGARVGSSSPRRRAQLLRWRPDLAVVEIRGNVDTRIGLVRSGSIDAAILAVAGIARLGREAEIARKLPTTEFLPAPAQGAIAVVGRAIDRGLSRLAQAVDDAPTHARVAAERGFAAAIEGDCLRPMGALATLRGDRLTLVGEVLTPDGRTRLRGALAGTAGDAERVGNELGRKMLGRGAHELWESGRR